MGFCVSFIKGRGNIVVVNGVPSISDVADTECLLHSHESVGDEPKSINNLVEDISCVDFRLLNIINDVLEVIPPGSLDAHLGVIDGLEELLGLVLELGRDRYLLLVFNSEGCLDGGDLSVKVVEERPQGFLFGIAAIDPS